MTVTLTGMGIISSMTMVTKFINHLYHSLGCNIKDGHVVVVQAPEDRITDKRHAIASKPQETF
jgi:hypothetical protein